MYRHSESTGAQSENLKNSPTYYIVSGGFDPIHEGHIEMIKAGVAASFLLWTLPASILFC